jgi:hypothetical protein
MQSRMGVKTQKRFLVGAAVRVKSEGSYRPTHCGQARGSSMVRWIAFDDETAEAVVSRLRRGAAEIQSNTPVDAALHNPGPSVIVLPSSTPGKLLIARFSQHNIPALETPAFPPKNQVAPFIPVPTFEKKPPSSAKKAWWRKIVA